MGRYTVTHRYFSVDNGQHIGPFEPGTEVELDDDRAAWVNRDSPGTLVPAETKAERPRTTQGRASATKRDAHRPKA